MRAGLAGCLAVLVAISGACGGRLVKGEDDDGTGADTGSGGGSSSGATMNRGATSSTGARSSTGGSKSTGMGGKSTGIGGKSTGVGASPTAGTTAAGGGCACPILDCAPGYQQVPNANGCCYHCESLCDQVACPGIACASGSHLEQLPGQCCPTCVPDNCAAQLANYQAFKQQLIDKYSTLGCMTDSDCTIYYEKNQCAVGCGIVMPSTSINNFDSSLQSFARSNCSPGCINPIPPCDAPAPPSCFKTWCE